MNILSVAEKNISGDIMKLLFCVLIGYAFGCVQTSYILIKRIANEDIRSKGSGNAGTMNTLLSFGKTPGVIVLFSDILKTMIPCILCARIFTGIEFNTAISFCALGVFVGHCFPFWLGFRGGKGVAIAIAFSFILDIRVFLISTFIAGIFGLMLRSATYSSYTFAIMLFVCAASFGYSGSVLVCILIESLLMIYLHIRYNSVYKYKSHSKS